ncbi:uncharacterized protein LOC122267095 [Penaeus japonicus]|uniref:uncharacterized protein LOC122267095 n=1 Tax=Penaeus japonicus TaxID=27405 RepID=UPI001C711438|nr:uncharacterized protein LOC122267095 [Penaeus japonicus]
MIAVCSYSHAVITASSIENSASALQHPPPFSMEQDLTCGVCSEVYSEGERDPVLLPNCGHTFCRPCLLSLEKNGCLECPFCRRLNDGVPVLQLPVVFALLGLTKHFRRSKVTASTEPAASTAPYWSSGAAGASAACAGAACSKATTNATSSRWRWSSRKRNPSRRGEANRSSPASTARRPRSWRS